MRVSAVLCHHKGTELITKAIESIKKSVGVEVEIIVMTSVSNCLFDGTKTVYVTGGPAHKRNVALRYVNSDYIAFFDDDIEVDPSAIYEMSKVLKDNPSVGMVFGKLLNMEFRNKLDEAGSFLTSTGFLWARAESGIQDDGQFESQEEVLAGKSASCIIRRRVFAEVGLFDSSYEILAEETDLAWRVWLSGYRVLYVPSSVTFHAFGTRFKPQDMYTPKRIYLNGCRNYLTMLYTNLGKKRWIIPVTTQLITWSVACIGMFLTGKREAAFNIGKGIFQFLRNVRTIWLKRFYVQRKLRKVSDKELMPIIMRNPPISYYVKRFLHYISTGRHG